MKCSSNIAVTNADTAIPPWKLSRNKTLNSQPLHCKHLAIMDSIEQQLKPQQFLRRSTQTKTGAESSSPQNRLFHPDSSVLLF